MLKCKTNAQYVYTLVILRHFQHQMQFCTCNISIYCMAHGLSGHETSKVKYADI